VIRTASLGLFALATLTFSQDYDPRFRTYDKFEYDSKPGGFPFRNGGSGVVDGADFIAVGGLDNGIGAFGSAGNDEVGKSWTFLRARRPAGEVDAWDILKPWDYGENLGQLAYEAAIDLISPFQYRLDVLNKQLQIESAYIKGYVDKFLVTHPNETNILFEIANEPNAYPIMSPEMYSWYFLSWRKVIQEKITEMNIERAQAVPAKSMLTAKFMPGGLWVFEGMPASLLALLKNGIHVEILGVSFNADGYPDTYKYYQDFLTALGKPMYCGWPKVGLNHKQCGDYNLGNLRNMQWYPMPDPNAGGRGRQGGYTSTYQALKSYESVPAKELIDVGNLHFYPYFAKYSTMAMTDQFAFWKKLVDLAADNTSSGEVYVTELGNVNPYNDRDASEKMAAPVLQFLQARGLPKVTRWYWYSAEGEDPKFKMLGKMQIDPQLGATALLAGADILSKLKPLVYVNSPLTKDQTIEIVDWASTMLAQMPVQGLKELPENGGRIRELGTTYYNFAHYGQFLSPPKAPANLTINISDYRDAGLAAAPWQGQATVEFDWDRPEPGYDVGLTAYYSTSSTPSAGGANVTLPSRQACTPNPSGSAYRYHCGILMPAFPFGTAYVQVKASDLANSTLSAVKSISHPNPVSTATSTCPSDLTKPLNLPLPLVVDASELVAAFDVNQSPLTMTNALHSGDQTLYATTAKAAAYQLRGSAKVLSASQLNNFSINKAAVNLYPDGACVTSIPSGESNYAITSLPASVKPDQFVFANPLTQGYFRITYVSGGVTKYITPGVEVSNPLPIVGVVYLGDFLAPGDVVKQVDWMPAAKRLVSDGSFPTYFKSISFSTRNPLAPSLPPFESPFGTITVNGEVLPAFHAAPGTPISIATRASQGYLNYTGALDAASVGKGMGLVANAKFITWTPTAAQAGTHVVTLTFTTRA
jgi:hypothetical protein